jgi:hypothetical protein
MLRLLQDNDFEIIEAAAQRRRRDHRDVIVISDDEDEDVENRPPNAQRRRTRPLSTDSLRSDSPVFFDTNERDIPDRTHHVSKRRKAERDDSLAPEKTRKTPLTGHEDKYTRTDLSLTPNSPHPSLLFRTGDNVQLPPSKPSQSDQSDFVQGSLHDPFDKNAPPPPQRGLCPYYYDQILEVKMYRGRGYEKFPTVLGTVKGHRAICDKWDADKNDEHEEDLLYIASLSGGVNPFTITKNQTAAKLERQCLREVQDVFPQIQSKFVLDRCRARAANNLDNNIVPSAAEIISEIAELDTYPREPPAEQEEEIPILPEDGTGVTIVYDKDVIKNESYRKQALRMLASQFTHIPTIAISRVLEKKQSLFDTFAHLTECEATYFDKPRDQKPYIRSRQPRVTLEKKYQRGFDEPNTTHLYQILVNELQAARQHEARELYRLKKDRDTEAEEAQNLLQHKLEGSLVECQTCFDDEIPMNRALMCEGDFGHFFCFGCVARLAESQIGAMKHEMMCMDGSGCKAVLSVDGVGRAVPTKVVDKLAFYQQQAEISAAGIEGLEQCPHCEYKGICDPVEEDSIFACQNPDCGKSTCRKCNEASHLPKTCEEAKKDKGLSARHLVEEARSEAMMRKCPKCKAKIIKELGCNKMICSCGNMMCYVCQQDISGQAKDAGYQHFHKAGSKCPLYDAQGTERHDQDADAAEKEAIAKVKAQEGNEDLDAKELEIETGTGKGKKKNAKFQPRAINAIPYPAFDGIAGVPLYQPGLLPGFAMPPAYARDDRPPAAHNEDPPQRMQRHAVLQAQIEELRIRGEMLRRRREELEDGRIHNVHQAAQDAQRDARAAQERMDRMIVVPYGGYGEQGQHAPAFGLFNPGIAGAGQAGPPFLHQPYEPPRQLYQPPPPPRARVQRPVPEQPEIDDLEMLLFGQRQQMNADPVSQRNRNRNAAQEALDNLDFADYVLRGGAR